MNDKPKGRSRSVTEQATDMFLAAEHDESEEAEEIRERLQYCLKCGGEADLILSCLIENQGQGKLVIVSACNDHIREGEESILSRPGVVESDKPIERRLAIRGEKSK